MDKLHRNDLLVEEGLLPEPPRRAQAAGEGDTAAATRQSAIQMRALADAAEGRGAPADAQVRAVAEGGLAGGSSPLPHLGQIQRSFGAYDVGGVRAHVGGAAAEAAGAMGAAAYTTGDRVAFGRDPDVHTAAHEAAHVVQQRAGVHFAGGVGREGDVHERQADAVADAVVAGQSAEPLLAQMAPASAAAAAGGAVQMRKLPAGEEAFEEMWQAHPHNYQDEEEENTSSEDVREEHGLPDYMDNTCAIRLSIMLNGIGERITPSKAKAAGIERKPSYSKKTKQYYIIAAREMWKYLNKHFRKADLTFPKSGRYKNEAEFDAAYESTIKPAIQGGKGIVAFDKVFTFDGTGHVDLFDGERLSDAPGWYPSERVQIWYVAAP